MDELKTKFVINHETIDVDRKLIQKYKLTFYDIKELMMILFIYKKDEITTINSKLLPVFKDYKINYIEEGIGWRVLV